MRSASDVPHRGKHVIGKSNICLFLVGSVRLSFEPSLTMKDVESANSKLIKGQFQPNCKPRQNVAILIPHRNREMHLLYLLHHLHPFLQRQQLHYGIYVIHQVQLFNPLIHVIIGG